MRKLLALLLFAPVPIAHAATVANTAYAEGSSGTRRPNTARNGAAIALGLPRASIPTTLACTPRTTATRIVPRRTASSTFPAPRCGSDFSGLALGMARRDTVQASSDNWFVKYIIWIALQRHREPRLPLPNPPAVRATRFHEYARLERLDALGMRHAAFVELLSRRDAGKESERA